MNKWFKEKSYEHLKSDDYEEQKHEEIKRRSESLVHKYKKQYPDEYTTTQVLKWREYYYILFNGEYPCCRTNYIRLLERDFWDDAFINKESICYTGYNGSKDIEIIENTHLPECTVIAKFV